jgi:hypothetical protein
MLDRLSIDRRLSEIDDAMHAILTRLDALEARVPPERAPAAPGDASNAPAAPGPPARPVAPPGTGRTAPSSVLSFAGRTFIVLGGAFLLRALTESGVLPPSAGAWAGIAYAAAWLVAAARAGGTSALFHGLAALIVALPLIVESSARFGFFSAIEGTAALAGISLLAIGVGWQRHMPSLAAVALIGALLASVVIVAATGHFVPVATALIAIGIASLWVGYDADWPWLAWPAAALANVAVFASSMRAVAEPPRDTPASALTLLALLVLAYLGSFALRNLFHERSIRSFEIVQTVIVLVIGFTGAVTVGRHYGYQLAFIAVPSLVAGLVTYAQVFGRVMPRRGRGGISLRYYLSLAFALTVAGLALLLGAPARSLVMAASAVAAAAAAWRLAMPLLAIHGAVAALIGAVHSGLIGFATAVWLQSPDGWPELTTAAIGVFVALCLCYALPRPAMRSAADEVMVACARTPVGALMVLTAGALLVAPVATALAAHAGWLATLKTVILAAAAVVLARARQWPRLVELGWLTYPVLAIALVKIFVEDLSVSAPLMLVIAFMAYGAALVLASRGTRKSA